MPAQDMNVTVIVADPRPASPTLAAAMTAAGALTAVPALDGGYQLIDLSSLSRRLLLPEPSAAIEDAVYQVTLTDLLVIASPVIHGSYSGLLKVFADRLPPRALRQATALPLLVLSSPRQAAAAEMHLLPLLAELGASAPVGALAIAESQASQPGQALADWVRRVTEVIGSRASEPVPAGRS